MGKHFGVMLDMSRNGIMKPDEVKKYAATIKKLGYNMLQLYTEDTYEVPGETWFAGGARTWVGFASNNAFSLKTMSMAITTTRQTGALH